jgi:hypothetical protein
VVTASRHSNHYSYISDGPLGVRPSEWGLGRPGLAGNVNDEVVDPLVAVSSSPGIGRHRECSCALPERACAFVLHPTPLGGVNPAICLSRDARSVHSAERRNRNGGTR